MDKNIAIAFIILFAATALTISFMAGKDTARDKFRGDVESVCKTGDIFTITDRKGLFSCYRVDIND